MFKRLTIMAFAAASVVGAASPVSAQSVPAQDPSAVPTTTVPAAGPTPLTVPALPPRTLPPTPPMPSTPSLDSLLPALTPITDNDQMAALRDRYGSLSTTMLTLWADQAGTDVSTFVTDNKPGLATAFATPSLMTLDMSEGGDLTAQLADVGIAVDWRTSGGGLGDYGDMLAQNTASIESQVASAGAEWATAMASVRTPELSAPDMPDLAVPEAQMFGLLADRSVTAMITDQPDLFASVRSSGIGTPAAGAAWRASMVNALAATTNPDPAAGMISPCYSAMMTAMGSGDSTAASKVGGKDCSPCVTTGLYLNGQLSRLFDPGTASATINRTDSLLPPAEFNDLPGWQRQVIVDQNPSLKNGLSSAINSGVSAQNTCGGSGPATAAAANTVLPGVFSQLNLG